MRYSSLFLKTLAVLCAATIGVVLAQENMRPPTGAPQAGRGQAGPQAGAAMPTNPALAAPPAADQATYRQQVSYVLGRQYGDSLRENQVELDVPSLMAGLNDGLTNAKSKWTDAEIQSAMRRFEQEMTQKATLRQQQLIAKNRAQEEAFLAANRQREGVQVTPSGLQYRVLKSGNGPSPTRADVVRCNYRGTLLSGEEFDSSQRHGGPASFPVGQVIPGWTEALQKMKVGDTWQLFVPSALAYGPDPDPRSGIEPGAMLIFEVELLEIVK